MEERLQKLLARAGMASRRACEDFVRTGRVSVNGRVVTELGTRADPERDDVRLDGERIRAEPLRMLVLHKPAGFVTTLSDPQGRPTIRELIPEGGERVFPVGRLDFSSSGLLLVGNDGELAARLLHPRSRIPRTYRVKVQGHPSDPTLARLRRGVRLDDGVTGPARVDVEKHLPGKTWLRITLCEGKRREIRRMCETVGHRVDRLVRVRFGPIHLGRLRPGRWRPLRKDEIDALREVVGAPTAAARREGPHEGTRGLTSSSTAANHDRSSRARAAMRGVEQSGSSRGS